MSSYNISEEITTTKISDLPTSTISTNKSNNFIETMIIKKEDKLGEIDTIYKTLDVHPNPYIPEIYNYETQYPLPTRDIPNNMQSYNIDPCIKTNYIPPPAPKIDDYLRDTEIITNKRIKKHQEKQKRKNDLMDILSDFQFTIFISLLFLIFNLPIINILLFSILSRFDLFFYLDGNLNFYGLLIKSLLFGFSYYILHKIIDLIIVTNYNNEISDF